MTTESIFWVILAACVGGIFVLVGLLMETLSEKKWFKDIKSMRFCDSVKRWGEWIVIFGIVIEVVVAGWSAKDSWEKTRVFNEQITVANDKIANLDRTKPINSVSARFTLVVRSRSISDVVPTGNTICELSFFNSANKNNKSYRLVFLAEQIEKERGDLDLDELKVTVQFRFEGAELARKNTFDTMFVEHLSPTQFFARGIAVSAVDNFDSALLKIPIKPVKGDFDQCLASLIINDVVVKQFWMSPTNPITNPMVFSATLK